MDKYDKYYNNNGKLSDFQEPFMDMEKDVQQKTRMKPQVRALILPDTLLVIQFILGMYNNLYVTLPKTGFLNNWKFVARSIPESLHILNGIIIVVLTFITLAKGIRMKNRHLTIVGIIGGFAMLLAFIGGILYVSTQNDIWSYAMSIGFLIGILNFNIGVLTL
jgi:hypothetical protein